MGWKGLKSKTKITNHIDIDMFFFVALLQFGEKLKVTGGPRTQNYDIIATEVFVPKSY